ncbi:protein FAM161A [Denticeps clupeoides]|uniref:protein FAM161A n=1 Tax=Denticeps clupeoides TaxID=299321 RepID=UPI0010A4904F|nr:protein FAM161A-like [Denticeps clupeoides]
MERKHRANVLVTSCLKTPVDPQTKAPLALYEREKALPYASGAHMDNRDQERQMDCDSGSDCGANDSPGNGSPILIKDYRVTEDHIDLREFYFSNEEYYRKLEQLKKAHLHTMAQLEQMYRKRLHLKGADGPDWAQESSTVEMGALKKAHSAHELWRDSETSERSNEDGLVVDDYNETEKGLLTSPKEHIRNMWKDFAVDKLHPRRQHGSSSSVQTEPDGHKSLSRAKTKVKGYRRQHKAAGGEENEQAEGWRPRVTVPKPFQMTLREAEKRRRGVKTRSEVERENAELRRQLEELTECQRKFRASSVPAHVRLPLYEELLERDEERRRLQLKKEQRCHNTSQKPFSFLERERLKKEQREELLRKVTAAATEEENERRKRPFRAKPVPRAVKEASSGEQQKEEQLYRSIKMQMRARELLLSASMPPSMLARRLSERKKAKEGLRREDDSHRPRINAEVPDFDSSYRRFQKQLASRRDVRPVTACEPFQLRTANISSHHGRIMADIEAERSNSRESRWPFLSPSVARTVLRCTPPSSLCSSLSGSQEILSAKITDAAKKRQEAVRKALEQRKKAEEEEQRWREKQKQRERKLQKVVAKRAQANDPHVALSQTCQAKLKEFRKQDLQRRREYREEMKEIQERVKTRPLLLEQVAKCNAKQAAVKHYNDTLRECGLTEDFVSRKAGENCCSGQELRVCHVLESDHNEPVGDSGSFEGSFPDDYPDDYDDDYCDHDPEGEEEEDYGNRQNGDQTDSEKGGEDGCSYEDELCFDYDDDDYEQGQSDNDIIAQKSLSGRSSHSHHGSKGRKSSRGSMISVSDGENVKRCEDARSRTSSGSQGSVDDEDHGKKADEIE